MTGHSMTLIFQGSPPLPPIAAPIIAEPPGSLTVIPLP
jgi:hypothetical protein